MSAAGAIKSGRAAMRSVTLLAYHRVEPAGNPDLSPDLLEATPEQFEAQMRYLSARYTVISPFDLVRALRDGYTLPRRALAITFDDGYSSFPEHVMPVLRRLGLPAGLFAVTGHAERPSEPFWWDALHRAITCTQLTGLDVHGVGELPLGSPVQRERAYKRLVAEIERSESGKARAIFHSAVTASGVEPAGEQLILGWEELQALSEEGVAIGPHSRTHPILSRVGHNELRAEVAGSWQDLREKIPGALPIFCYPNGKPHAINPAVTRAVRQAGLVGGLTMVAGLNTPGRTDPYLLRRVGMRMGEPLPRLAFKLTPIGRFYLAVKRLAANAYRGRSG